MQKVVSAIKSLLDASVANENSPIHDIKRVFFGDPITIPENDLPAIAVQPVNTEFTMRGSRYDQKTHTIEVRLVYNQKHYYGKNLGEAVTITDATFSSGSINFTAIGHGLSQGDSIVVSETIPTSFSGTFQVTSVSDEDNFSVAKLIDPGIYTAGGKVKKAISDKVFAIEDAINKVEEMNADHSTASLSVCGTIQSNPSLPYSDGSNVLNAAEIAQVKNVNYSLSENRGFPTFEVVTTVEVKVIGDR